MSLQLNTPYTTRCAICLNQNNVELASPHQGFTSQKKELSARLFPIPTSREKDQTAFDAIGYEYVSNSRQIIVHDSGLRVAAIPVSSF